VKSQPQTTTSQSKTEIPGWLADAAKYDINFAKSLPDFTPYTGQGVANLNPDQQTAFQLARDNVGAGKAVMAPAAGGFTNAMNFAVPMLSGASVGADAAGLFNPYTKTVVQGANDELNRQRMIQGNQLDAQAAKSGALGGDRNGVVIGMNNRDFNTIGAQTTAKLMEGGWDSAMKTALGIGQGNQGASIEGAKVNLAGAGGLLNTGTTTANLGNNDVNSLLTTGGTQQQNDQQKKTFDYQEFMRQLQERFQKAQTMTAATNGAPHGTETNGSQTTMTQSSPLAQIAGLGLTAASMFMPGGPALMAGLSGGAGAGLGLLGSIGGGQAASATQPWGAAYAPGGFSYNYG
jgi:hypothetical protein